MAVWVNRRMSSLFLFDHEEKIKIRSGIAGEEGKKDRGGMKGFFGPGGRPGDVRPMALDTLPLVYQKASWIRTDKVLDQEV